MDDQINRLRDMLAQLSPDRQRAIIPQLIELVEWFSEPEEPMPTATTGDWGSSRSICFSFSRSRSTTRSIS